jgi:hypothetical protein
MIDNQTDWIANQQWQPPPVPLEELPQGLIGDEL